MKIKLRPDTMHQEEQPLPHQEDEVLAKLKEAVDPIVEMIDQEPAGTRAAFIIAGKEMVDSASGEYSGIQTFIDVVGDYGIIEEALYAELCDQIEKGIPDLFHSIRKVIREIETQHDIDDSDEMPIETRVLH